MAAHASRTPWQATPFIAIATFLGLYGLSTMLEMGPWVRTVAVVLLVATATLVITRLLSRSRVLPTLLAALVSVVVMIPLFARREDGSAHLLPTPGGLGDLGAAMRGGVEYAAVTIAPAPEALPLTALITAVTVALFLVAEHLAVSWRAAATAGLLLLIPWLPAVIFQHRISTGALIAAIIAWLLALALARRVAGSERRPAVAGALTATAATMGGVLLVAPTALGGLGWGMIPRIDAPASLETATRLNLDLDLRTSLTTNSTTPVMVYTTEGPKPDAFKLYALTDFDGVKWSREEAPLPGIAAGSGLLWPEPVESWNDQRRQRIDMQVLNLQETNLPLPPSPRTLDLEGPWFYDSERDEVVSDEATAREMQYSIVTDPRFVSDRDLRETQERIDGGEDPTDPRYLSISPAIDASRVESLATELTSEAETRYDQAIAIQQFLRDPLQFTYDTSVSPSGGDAISTFLDDRSGYCVQFATTMVMMARSLDIPARMSVGFLAGSATDADTFVIQGGDAHAWPELWFPGAGWVRFEPTPAVQTGAPPEYADPFTSNAPIPEDVLNGGAAPGQPLQPQLPEDVPNTTGIPAVEDQGPEIPILVFVLAGAVLVLGGLGAWWWMHRSRRPHGAPKDAEDVWSRLRESLPEPMRWSSDLTPHEAAQHVEAGMREFDTGLSGQAREDLTRLANAVADHRYAPDGTLASLDTLSEWAAAVDAEAQSAESDSARAQRSGAGR
ncbi:transglutaminase family protein [Demequina activiva]|uniref:Transglutaminase n=1 Tax=Demequina activiva TaxID=1582364 RepID=A0A919Q3L3_9MICO|nr:transglutaminaseTgpA domain-containing protein [Demequina activiva]GIG54276.1 transglutaminase [Demequina activiva]